MAKENIKIILEDGSEFTGTSFGYKKSIAGEVVFNTGMVGYPETLTDPSYYGQILVLTYPLVGNYGVPGKKRENKLLRFFESDKIQVRGLIVSDYSKNYSHFSAVESLGSWLKREKVPGIYDVDTRELTKKLREKGVMLGKIVIDDEKISFDDPNVDNLSAKVSLEKPITYGRGKKIVLAVDLGIKNNIIRSFIARGVKVKRVPYNYDFTKEEYDGLFLSNGPGDPKKCKVTVSNVKKAMKKNKPIFGICFGNQILGLAAGGDTYKLKYGHRSQNQPALLKGTKQCFITSQNHGYAVDDKKLPRDWDIWFYNLNDKTNEGIRHKKRPWMSVQFHPEAAPGPTDTAFLFDDFINML